MSNVIKIQNSNVKTKNLIIILITTPLIARLIQEFLRFNFKYNGLNPASDVAISCCPIYYPYVNRWVALIALIITLVMFLSVMFCLYQFNKALYCKLGKKIKVLLISLIIILIYSFYISLSYVLILKQDKLVLEFLPLLFFAVPFLFLSAILSIRLFLKKKN